MKKWFTCRCYLVASMLLYSAAMPVAAADDGAKQGEPAVVELQSRWQQSKFLHFTDGGQVSLGAAGAEAGRWTLEPARGSGGGAFVIRHGMTGQLLSAAEGDSSALVAVNAAAVGDRSRWIIEPVDTFVTIRNAATGKYLNIEKQGTPDVGLDKQPDAKNWWSGLWQVNRVSGGELPRFRKAGLVMVTSPAYGSTISGDVDVRISAPGFGKATVRCWSSSGDAKFGRDSVVGEADLDDDGAGVVRFPASDYPRGPVCVRVSATQAGKTSNYYLMLYNTAGKQWNAGIPSKAPPAAEGMKLAFADDFDKPELSITKDGSNATYMSHKPGGGDFSGIPFGDHENRETTPFSQVDTYLRIRADQSKKTTGLLSSLRKDGTGFTATVPCYFEARLIAQSAPGTWPAFWTMTTGVHKGLKTPADELDVIEAYGGEGKGNPNQRGYWIHSHYWNQAPDGGKDYSQDRFADQIKMTQIPGGGEASWYETFHTYGVLIGKEYTVYYCDDIEVARHKTARLSLEQPHFFFVNFAIGGASGWKIDLSQYGGVADMYVDYVRVYQGK